MQPTSWSPPPPAPAGQSGCLHAVLFAIACAWMVGVTVVAQSAPLGPPTGSASG